MLYHENVLYLAHKGIKLTRKLENKIYMKEFYLAPETESLELLTEHPVLDPMSPVTMMALMSSNMEAEEATLYNGGEAIDW